MCVWKLLADLRTNFQFTLFSYLFIKNNDIKEKIKKVTNPISIIRKMNLPLPRSSILTTSKSFVEPHLDCGDVIYNQPNNSSLSDKIESVQYKAVVTITGTIKGA